MATALRQRSSRCQRDGPARAPRRVPCCSHGSCSPIGRVYERSVGEAKRSGLGGRAESVVPSPRDKRGSMEGWRRNLYVVWFATFASLTGGSLVQPFLPLF